MAVPPRPIAGTFSLRGNRFAPQNVRAIRRSNRVRAFSLIECTLAIGIAAFALVSILGLMPMGMVTFQKAMDSSTSSRIVQQVVTEIQQGASLQSQQPMRYFDDQGIRQADASGSGTKKPLYYVNTVISSPSDLPGGVSTNLATITVEIVKNQSNQPLERNPTTSAIVERPGVSVARYPVLIAPQG